MATGGGDIYNESARVAFVTSLLNVLEAGNKIELIPNLDGTVIKIENKIYDYVKNWSIKWNDAQDKLLIDCTAVKHDAETSRDTETAVRFELDFTERVKAALPDTLMGKPKRSFIMLDKGSDFDKNHGLYELPTDDTGNGDSASNINLLSVPADESDIGKVFTFIKKGGGSSRRVTMFISEDFTNTGYYYIRLRCTATMTLMIVGISSSGTAVFRIVGVSSYSYYWVREGNRQKRIDILSPFDTLPETAVPRWIVDHNLNVSSPLTKTVDDDGLVTLGIEEEE